MAHLVVAMFEEAYNAFLLGAGAAVLLTTLGLKMLNRFDLPKFFLYLPVGIIVGILGLTPDDPLESMELLERVTEFAVIVSLVVAGLKIGRPLRWRAWRSTGRLILLVMPITILAIAVVAHVLLGLGWGPALLLGAILAPTDPVLAGAVQLDKPTEDDELRFGLTSEAGLNDGFAFPFVYLGLYFTLRADEMPGLFAYWVLKDFVYAIALGLAAGWLIGHLGGRAFLRRAKEGAVSRQRREIVPLAVLLVAYGSVELLGGYGFLSAFACGLGLRRAMSGDKEKLAELEGASGLFEAAAEAAAIILLGALFPARELLALGWAGVAFALVAILALRPLIVWASTIGGGFRARDRRYWSWFGIRGIGSLYYLSYAITFGLPDALARELLAASVLVVLVSNVLHGATVYPGMRRFRGKRLVHP